MSKSLNDFINQLGKTRLNLPASLLQTARQGIDEQITFPSTKNEAWKYTRLTRVSGLSLSSVNPSPGVSRLDDSEFIDIFFNGTKWEMSTPIEGLEICLSSDASPETWRACSMEGHVQEINTLSAQGGVIILVKKGAQIDKAIRLIHYLEGGNKAMVLHHQIVIEPMAKAQIEFIFDVHGKENYVNVLTDVFVEEGANLQIDKLQQAQGEQYTFCNERIYQERNSHFAMQTMTHFTHFTRNNVEVKVRGEGAHTQLYGAFTGEKQQHIDNQTYIHHEAPNCTSDENYKGVLADKATGVFNGKVKVYPDAQKINAYQSNKNILLSDFASVNAKPELEIYADDVKCSHGSTTGQLDQQALFFLRARGISSDKAMNMMIEAFLSEIYQAVQSKAILEKLTRQLD